MTKITTINSTDITITGETGVTVSQSTREGGNSSEVNNFNITGFTQGGRSTKVATLLIEAGTDRKFVKSPSLVIDRSSTSTSLDTTNLVRMDVDSVVTDTKDNVTAFNCSIKYKSDEASLASDNINYIIKAPTVKINSSVSDSIYSIDIGKSLQVSRLGEKRKITVRGRPGIEFKLAITKIVDNKDSSGRVIGGGTETSIIHKSLISAGSDTTQDSTLEILVPIIKEKIPASGEFSFFQTFPKAQTVKVTQVNGTDFASGATRGIFDSLAGVEVGDEISVGSTLSKVTVLNPSGSNANQLDLFDAITAADDALTTFTRGSRFAVNIESTNIGSRFSTSGWTIGRSSWSGWYSKILTQHLRPILILRATTNSLLYSINSQAIPGGGEQVYDQKYVGKPNLEFSTSNNYQGNDTILSTKRLIYSLASAGSETFSITKTPIFSSVDGSTTNFPSVNVSDWSNSISDLNGGTALSMNASISTAGLTSISITIDISVLKWGTEDVIMELDLDDIIGIS